ncbi:MAG: aminotransferase class III-fold pyridoxal phosphate-dependent enzyme [Bacteriovoracaceae bacterium]
MNFPFFMTWQSQKAPQSFKIKSYQGPYFVTDNDQKILDFSSTSYHTSFGGTPKKIINKVKNQLEFSPMACPKAITDQKVDVTNRLLDFLNLPEGKIYYTLSGAESVENALKIARVLTKTSLVISRTDSYHGATLGALTATGDWRNQANIVPGKDWSLKIPGPDQDPDASELKNVFHEHGPKISAVILEPTSGANGVVSLTQDWVKALNELKEKYQFTLIIDEVLTGFYRLGACAPLAIHNYQGLSPDIVCLGKNISAGVIPFGAIWVKQEIFNSFLDEVLPCGSTNYAHPLGLSALDGVLETLSEESFINHLHRLEKDLNEGLEKLKSLNQINSIRIKGLLACIDLKFTPSWQDLINRGLYVGCVGKRLIIAPPYILQSSELKNGIEIIQSYIEKASYEK